MKQELSIEIVSHYKKSPDTLIIPLAKKNLHKQLKDISEKHEISYRKINKNFNAKPKEVLNICPNNEESPDILVLIGLGDNLLSVDFEFSVRKYFYDNKSNITSVGFDFLNKELNSLQQEQVTILIEAGIRGLSLGLYELGMLKTNHSIKDKFIQHPKISLFVNRKYHKIVEKSVNHTVIIGQAQKKIFDLLNLPGNYINAVTLAAVAMESGNEYGYKVTVLDKNAIEKEGLGALLAVNKGSSEPPTFSILEYKPKGNKKYPKIGLVGKGVTFDTGGLSLKTAKGMYYMKSDMGGAAAVLGTIEVVARLKLPVHVIGIIPATDNKTGSSAIQPGDVITSYSGITIEVENTDAEGRMVLADGIYYLNKYYKPDVLIDIATLTGACVQSLGYHAAGLFSNDDKLAAHLIKAGEETSERVWRLPIWDVYGKQNDSDIADIKNLGGNSAGAITAAKFIQYFTESHPSWAHLDIAGTAFGHSLFSKGMSGTAFGVRLLTSYLEQLTIKNE